MKKYKIIENNITYDIEETDYGNKYWKLNGEFHRENGPAVEYNDSTKVWYKNGIRHRDDGPATEWCNGNKFWYKNGERHREDGPAVEWDDGSIEYYYNGNHLKHIKTDEDLKRYIKLLSIS